MKETWTSILHALGLAWWVEVVTATPECTYYFGPFLNADEAKLAHFGYLEDLEQEGAQGVQVCIKRCKPAQLTIEERNGRSPAPAYTG